jgi:hypothetical protein
VRDVWPGDGRVAVVPSPVAADHGRARLSLDGTTQTLDLQAFVSDLAATPAIIYRRAFALPLDGGDGECRQRRRRRLRPHSAPDRVRAAVLDCPPWPFGGGHPRNQENLQHHPSDPGGPTNFGITIIDYRKYVKSNATAADVRAMKVEEAKRIYREKY